EFYYVWNDLFREWFDSLYGWNVMQEQYADVSPSFKVAVAVDKSGASVQDGDYDRVAGRKLVLVAVVKSSLDWTSEGQEGGVKELEIAMRAVLSESRVPVVWGIAAIGFNWIALKQEGERRADS
ncbi:hypothetical protein FRC01_012724, partial [Tulasnella sp. 417]